MTRQRTPPVVKWVANELAALKGEVADLDQRIAQLQARRNAVYSKVEALSQVFGTVAPDLPLTLVPAVHAHGPYGGRGNLRAWLKQTLEAAYPQAVTMDALIAGAESAFGLQLDSVAERTRFRKNSMGRALRKALDAGEVERLHPQEPGGLVVSGAWRWRPPNQALTELQAAAKERYG